MRGKCAPRADAHALHSAPWLLFDCTWADGDLPAPRSAAGERLPAVELHGRTPCVLVTNFPSIGVIARCGAGPIDHCGGACLNAAAFSAGVVRGLPALDDQFTQRGALCDDHDRSRHTLAYTGPNLKVVT